MRLGPLYFLSFLGSVVAGDVSDALVQWLRDNGGFFSEKVEIRHLDPADTKSPRGMFAKESFQADETIMIIPTKCLLTTKQPRSRCKTVKALANHFRRGDKSFFKEYVDYLFDGTKRKNIPDRWSKEALEIMETIIGDDYELPFHERVFEEDCGGSGDPIEEDAYELLISRSWGEVMVPLLDMINHRNGKWLNVESSTAHNDEDIRVFATKYIEAGEQLHNTYNECEDIDCEGLFFEFGTAELLGDYGFVELYPQRWILDDFTESSGFPRAMVVELDEVEKPDPYDPSVNKTQVEVIWHTPDRPDMQTLNALTSQLKLLKDNEGYVEKATASLESGHERYAIREFYKSFRTVLEYTIWSSYDTAIDEMGESAGNKKVHHYDPLTKRPIIGVDGDYDPTTCNPRHVGMGPGYETIFEVQSQYQEIMFSYGEAEDDTCLFLSGWGQTCTSFRQYHEALVHYPASFLSEVKRVAYIGGGDNMILHEILKYPTIELVVGMELDQAVVRYSFMHLGTLPYFDDPRVQWWFGDATKSLLMLPDEYFGSFDLVLVDLQTFVADALSVTDKLSIMDSMKLLLNEKTGIMAKNEDFPNRQVINFAKYTVDMDYCDLPGICRQSITIGSNGINFLTAPQYEHNIERLYINDSVQPSGKFLHWYSFRDNSRLQLESQPGPIELASETQTKRNAAGILIVIEAEHFDGSVKTKEEVIVKLTQALTSHGMEVSSVDESVSGGGFDVALVCREGYVVARRRDATADYMAIDVTLWDKLSKINDIKKSVVDILGGSEDTSSSFRLVVGGIPVTKEEPFLVNHAPITIAAASKDSDQTSASAWSAFAELIDSSVGKAATVVILCGAKGDACSSSDSLKASSVNPIPLYICGAKLDPEDPVNLFECEKEMMKAIRQAAPNKKVSGIVIDTSSTELMARVLLRLLTGLIGRAELLDKDNYFVLTQLNGDEWREVFVERFRTEISPFEPGKEARVTFSEDEDYAYFSSGDVKFYHRLSHLLTSADGSHIDKVMSGDAAYVAKFDPPVFNNKSFDNKRAYQQWVRQKPTGYQAVFQMVLQAPKTPLEPEDKVLYNYESNVWLGRWARATVVAVNDDSTYEIRGSFGRQYNIPRDQLLRLDFDPFANPTPTFESGTRVLIHDKANGDFGQGFISSGTEQGDVYQVRLFDHGGAVINVNIADLIPQLEARHDDQLPILSLEMLEKTLRMSLSMALQVGTQYLNQTRQQVGGGGVITSFWKNGHVILVWDGSRRIDINMFMDEDETLDAERAANLSNRLLEKIPYLSLLARDEQPRGHGRVVNFANEIDSAGVPVWAKSVVSENENEDEDEHLDDDNVDEHDDDDEEDEDSDDEHDEL